MGITRGKFTREAGWCPTGTKSNPLWGPCMPKEYSPIVCVVTAWQAFDECSKTCGGGKMTRTRRVVTKGGAGSGCPTLKESRMCNAHSCGSTVTVTGGKKGYGVADAEGTPDLTHNPVSVTATQTGNVDVVYSLGSPKGNSDVKRIDVSHGSIKVGKAGQYIGGVGLGIATETQLYGVNLNHNVGSIDLRLHIKCQPWMTDSLNTWQSDPTKSGVLHHANPVQLKLTPAIGSTNEWRFTALRKVKYESFPDFLWEGRPQWKGDLTKNVLCMREAKRANQEISPEACCVTKNSPSIKKPCGPKSSYGQCHAASRGILEIWEATKAKVAMQLKGI